MGTTLKPTFKYNNIGVKSSCDQYRNINGIHYRAWTSDNNLFKQEKAEAKRLGLKFKIIKGESYREVK